MKRSTATALLAVFGSIGGALLMCLLALASVYIIFELRTFFGLLIITVPLIFAAAFLTALLREKLNLRFGIKIRFS